MQIECDADFVAAVQDNLFECYLGIYLELEHFLRKSRKKGMQNAHEKKIERGRKNAESHWEELIVLFSNIKP